MGVCCTPTLYQHRENHYYYFEQPLWTSTLILYLFARNTVSILKFYEVLGSGELARQSNIKPEPPTSTCIYIQQGRFIIMITGRKCNVDRCWWCMYFDVWQVLDLNNRGSYTGSKSKMPLCNNYLLPSSPHFTKNFVYQTLWYEGQALLFFKPWNS